MGIASISDHTVPGGHSAAGDKEAKKASGANRFAIQALEPGAPPLSHASSSASPSPSPQTGSVVPPAQSSSALPAPSPDAVNTAQETQPDEGDSSDDEEDCDEL